MTITRHHVGPRISEAAIRNGTIEPVGQVAEGDAAPRATVIATFARPQWLLEIVITAAQK